MAKQDCEVKKIHFAPEVLNIPILLSTRNRFKFDFFRTIPNYIKKKRSSYAQNCYSEERNVTKTKEQFRRLIGKYPTLDESCFESRTTNAKRLSLKKNEHNPPPNIYDISYLPYSSRRGIGGAYWKKLKEEITDDSQQSKKYHTSAKPKEKWKFYNILNGLDRLNLPGNKFKGIFLSNPRKRRATTRCMVFDPALIYREPSEPSPAQYNVKFYTIAYNMSPRRYQERPNPHLFLPRSCVPTSLSSLLPRHISFRPAVGRYEIRYPKHCPCRKKKFTPGLRLLVDREKRNRFRHITYNNIKINVHCDPDWDHVIGHGHQHLFHLHQTQKNIERTKNARRLLKSIHMFHDFKYLRMISSPDKEHVTRFSIIDVEPQVRFNCIFKRDRRILHIDRKVGFGGGAARFHDYIPTIFTNEKIKKLIENLPPGRQLRNHPVTRSPIEDIKSRLVEIPEHMKSIYTPNLRKNLFKFPPLPDTKLLVTKNDLLPELAPNEVYKPPRAFNKPIDVKDFVDELPDKETSVETLERNSY